MARVVLNRIDWGRRDRLPPCCVYCGRPADGYSVKSLKCQTGGLEGFGSAPGGEAAAVGAVLGVVKLLAEGAEPVRTTRLQVHLPVCDRHRRAWLIWSWFRMSLDHDTLVMAGVASEFARAVEAWRRPGEPPPQTQQG